MRQLYFKDYENHILHENWKRRDKFVQENAMEIEYKTNQSRFFLEIFRGRFMGHENRVSHLRGMRLWCKIIKGLFFWN